VVADGFVLPGVCSYLQAHVLFTSLTGQLSNLGSAAETVAAAITSEHAMQVPSAGQGRFAPAGGSSSSSSTGSRKQRAEARQRAFAAAALARCTARLTGQRSTAAKTAVDSRDTGDISAQAGQYGSNAGPTRTADDEVAALVGAATSVDKLSRMYEGWAAWL
jgi:PI-3-kinase-related kinase SMG-1